MTEHTAHKLEYTLSTLAIENLFPSKDAIRYCEQISDGRLDKKTAVQRLLQKYGVKQGANHV